MAGSYGGAAEPTNAPPTPVRQPSTILGDEMELGKTVEALAATGDLRLAEGASHFLVVCPAGVVRNWAVEVWKFTTLPNKPSLLTPRRLLPRLPRRLPPWLIHRCSSVGVQIRTFRSP